MKHSFGITPRPIFMPQFFDPEICRTILESLPTGLCVIDLDKKILLWSDGAEDLTGRLRHEVIGRICVGETFLLRSDLRDREWCDEESPLLRTIKTSQPAEAVGFIHHKAGHEVAVRSCAVPVRNAHGSIIGAVAVFQEQSLTADLDHREDATNPPGSVDETTGVASYTMMRSHLRESLGTFTEMRVPLAVLLLRLEGLEQFRVSTGSNAAASLLCLVARTLEGALWKTDFVGRWSDEQFLLILNGCRENALRSVRERVQRMLASDGIEWWGEKRSLPVSIGEAIALSGDSTESIMERARKSVDAAGARRSSAAAGGQQPA
jgi:diguanylate cyclase (GGDEF)-like protein/PAS domain S-box-containing protein